mmetsp:Transcript_14877/g.23060  ORF Transcript_14877/g.23060 Transcript_14877/m.23060 type:complete len:268 (+) Transcript_14877:556-1359(+)
MKQFFGEFIDDDAPFGFDTLSTCLEHHTIQKQPLKKDQISMSMVVPVSGVPFIKQTRCNKNIFIRTRAEDKLVVEMESQTIDAPYSDCFLCKEAWIVVSDSASSCRCVLQKYIKIHFVKSTMFKSKIMARAEEGMRDAAVKWLQFAKDKGHLDKKPEAAPVEVMSPEVAAASPVVVDAKPRYFEPLEKAQKAQKEELKKLKLELVAVKEKVDSIAGTVVFRLLLIFFFFATLLIGGIGGAIYTGHLPLPGSEVTHLSLQVEALVAAN